MAEVGRQPAVGARAAHVLDHRLRHGAGGVAGDPQPEAEIDVLTEAEVVLVEPAGRQHGVTAVEGSRGAWREDLAGDEVGRFHRSPVPFPPGQAAHVPAVADSVDHARLAGEHLPRPERGACGMGGGGGHERLQPAGLREGVGIEQRDELRLRQGEAAVGARREAEVRLERCDRRPSGEAGPRRDQIPAGRQGAVATGVVDKHDPRGRHGLGREALQAADHVGSAVEVDDHDGYAG